MAEFVYQGVDKQGKRIEGKLDAPTEGDLRMMLRGMGIRPVRISKPGMLNRDLGSMLGGGGGGMNVEALVIFTRQLTVLIGAGVPLVQALDALSDQAADKSAQSMILGVKEKVSTGAYFWEAISAYPRTFPKLYVALVRAGEASGAMDAILKRLSRYLEDEDRLRKMVKSAMMYPAIVVTIGVGVVSLMLIFVIPKFEEMLVSAGQELPMPTQFVISASKFLIANIHYILIGLVASFVLIRKYLRTDEGKAFKDRIMFRAPIFGIIAQKGGVARFARTMQTLLASGVNLIDAIDICKSTVDNAVIEDAVGKIRAEIEAGKTFGSVVARLPVFPKMAVQMISIGESTGNLDRMLEKIADFYEAEVETLVGGLTKLMEPIILVFLGGTVGGMMIAMYLPIFKLAGGA